MKSLSHTLELSKSHTVCTIVRAPAWRDVDPFTPMEQGIAEALYGVDAELIVVSDWGAIDEEDWRWEGCRDVARRDLIEPLFGHIDQPQFPSTLHESFLAPVPAGSDGGDGAR
jgi:hypothetical protein